MQLSDGAWDKEQQSRAGKPDWRLSL